MPDVPKGQDANEILMQLRYLQSLYSQQYENLNNNIATYTMTNTALQRNLDLLEKSKSIEGSNIMISGEGGAYVPAKIEKVDKVMTYVGGDYLIETTVETAKEFLGENIRRGEEIIKKLVSDRQKIENDLFDIQYKLSALDSQMNAQK